MSLAPAGARRYLRPSVLGGVDGIVTSLAVLAGGASAPMSTVVVIAVASLVADAMSMGISEYLSVRADAAREARASAALLAHDGATRRRMAADATKAWDMTSAQRQQLHATVASNDAAYVAIVGAATRAAASGVRGAALSGVACAISFAACGAVVVVAWAAAASLWAAAVVAAVVLAALGWARTGCSARARASAVGVGETLALGAVAGGVAYAIGTVG